MKKNQTIASRGYIIPIGGGENKQNNPVILKRFIKHCGGNNAHIAIIPTASSLSDTGGAYQELFHQLGVKRSDVLNPKRRSDCDLSSSLDLIDAVDGVFMTGGDQLKLAAIVAGTPLAAKLRDRNSLGMHVAGTSAGASFMSEHMIAGGKTGIMPRSDMVKLATGLGLIDDLIIDQHFRQRNRFGRLLTAASFNPSSIGIGLDEDTAAFIDADNQLEIVGSGWATIIDPSEIEMSTIDSSKSKQHLSVADLRIHMLASGDQYKVDLHEAILTA